MDSLDFRLLRAFLVLMSEKSVSRTAARLNLSQPATSHVLARLRQAFNDPLLLRSRTGMIATSRALQIEQSVRTMLGEYERLMTAGQPFDPVASQRTFVMTAPEFGEQVLVPDLFKRLRDRAPGVRVEVRAPSPERAYEQLESGEIDLRIAWLTKPLHVSLRSIQLFQDRMVCIADCEHPSVRGNLTLAQFLALPHARTLGYSHATTSRVIDEAVARHGKKLERSFLVQNFLTIPSALAGTDIIATLPYSLAAIFAEQHPLQVLEPPLRLPRVRYAAYWHERSQNDVGHRWLRELLAEVGRSIVG